MRCALLCGVVLAAAFGGGCFKGNFENCAVQCATDNDCPGGLTCSSAGRCSSGVSCDDVVTDADVDADLTMPQPLTVTKTGDGTVTSDPAGIDCGAQCTAMFDPLSTVNLTATPGTNSVVDLTGDCVTSPCAVTMDGAKSVAATFAVRGSRRWHAQPSYPGDELWSRSTIDAQGNYIVAEKVSPESGVTALVVFKYAGADGAVVWDKRYDVTSSMYTGGMATDADGNIYYCARLLALGAATIDGMPITGDFSGNVMVLRMNGATGAIEWVKTWGGGGQDECGGIAVSGDNFFVSGRTSSTSSTWDAQSLGDVDGFLLRGNRNTGTVEQIVAFTGNYSIRDIAVNGTKLAVAGTDSAAGMAGSCNVQLSPGMPNAFIAQFSQSNLSCDWAKGKRSSTNIPASVNAVAAVPDDTGWITTGSYEGAVLFQDSGSPIPNAGGSDAFLVRWNTSGTAVYQYGYGTAASEYGDALDITPTGEVVWGGHFSSTLTLGQFALTGANDIFLTKMSAGLTPLHQWAVTVGGPGASESLADLNVDAQGSVFLLGYFTGMTLIDGTPLSSQGYDGFVASFVR